MITNPTTVVNKRIHPALPGDIYIGRPYKWGNPFYRFSKEENIRRYSEYLIEQIRKGVFTVEDLKGLYGRRLVCWCEPLPCHGWVLARAANWAKHTHGLMCLLEEYIAGLHEAD